MPTITEFFQMSDDEKVKHLDIDVNKYRRNIKECIADTKYGRHLRFISIIYRTPEVCMWAVLRHLHQYGNTPCGCCLGCVPDINLEEMFRLLIEEMNIHTAETLWNELEDKFRTTSIKNMFKSKYNSDKFNYNYSMNIRLLLK